MPLVSSSGYGTPTHARVDSPSLATRSCSSPFVWDTPREKTLSLPPGFEQGEAVARHPLSRQRVRAPTSLGGDTLCGFFHVPLAFRPHETVVALEEVVHICPGRERWVGSIGVGAVGVGARRYWCSGSGALRQRGDKNRRVTDERKLGTMRLRGV